MPKFKPFVSSYECLCKNRSKSLCTFRCKGFTDESESDDDNNSTPNYFRMSSLDTDIEISWNSLVILSYWLLYEMLSYFID